MTGIVRFWSWLFFVVTTACGPEIPAEVEQAMATLPEEVDFNIHVRPILSDKCYKCHGPDKGQIKAGLQLHDAALARAPLPESPGKVAVFPGSLRKSELVHRILSTDDAYRMPDEESGLTLSDYEKAVLLRWIEDGAEYKPHWAFIKPEKKHAPPVVKTEWPSNEIDRFVLAGMEAAGLQPSPPAQKEILLRRISLDLTGLPPTMEEIEDFVSDQSPNAYNKVVERLLASPHYGEKMALHWMDLSRFADTHGYTVDRYRDMSPYRDWVIGAFNNNLRYDEFVTWQIAGDMLPDATYEQKLATAFNRIHPQNMEGGIVREEFRVEYVIDRVNTTGLAFMGMTVGCARCHDHKFDPISHKNFYELYSFFNNVNEEGQISWDDATPVPNIVIPDARRDSILNLLEARAAAVRDDIAKTKQQESGAFRQWIYSGGHNREFLNPYPDDLIALFTFDGKSLVNRVDRTSRGSMEQNATNGEQPVFATGRIGDGLLLNGDAWFDLNGIGAFRRSRPFSAGLWVKMPSDIRDGVILHKGNGAVLYNFRGYHLELRNNKLYIMMAHTAPDNAIVEAAGPLPRDRWVHLMITHDGSGKASGFKLFMDGAELATRVEVDNLTRDILFKQGSPEPGIQIGAVWRGKGVKGAVIDDVSVFARDLSALEVMQVAGAEKFRSSLASARSDREMEPLLEEYYWSNVSGKVEALNRKLETLRAAWLDSMAARSQVMVMKEMDQRRPAHILERGQYDAKGEEVFPNTPESILPMPEALPRNRLGLAQWLVHEDHPLTARVAVNRFWQMLFGYGIVKTSEDFGNQGEMPSHPELLDWLAVDFMESGWDVKAILRKIVHSSTYKQSSRNDPAQVEKDPENRLLSRGPAKRLSGELLRDNALAASGLLVREIGGRSVFPYQPEGLWKINGAEYRESKGKDLYRRSLYTVVKRTVPHPTLGTFDAPARSECIARRQETNTPLQALVLLNDPTYVEAAKVLGLAMSRIEGGEEAVRHAFLRLTGRQPMQEELSLLLTLRDTTYRKFRAQPVKAKGWLSAGAYSLGDVKDPSMVAANAVVASTIMNSDATVTKR